MKCEQVFQAWGVYWLNDWMKTNMEVRNVYIAWARKQFTELGNFSESRLFSDNVGNNDFLKKFIEDVLWPEVLQLDNRYKGPGVCYESLVREADANIFVRFRLGNEFNEVIFGLMAPGVHDISLWREIIAALDRDFQEIRIDHPEFTVELAIASAIFSPIVEYVHEFENKRTEVHDLLRTLIASFLK
jgi:hypothetical protein